MAKRWWLPLLLFAFGALALWPLRHTLTAQAIAAGSPKQMAWAAAFLLLLYAAKGVSVVVPLSVLEAAGGLLFPFPAALAVNFAGVMLTQAGPYFLGRREQAGLLALEERCPRLLPLARPAATQPARTVFLLRLGGVSPGDLVSFFLGAAGVSGRAYFSAGFLGSLPRIVAATALGSALWEIGGRRFWISMLAGTVCSAISLLLWRRWRRT